MDKIDKILKTVRVNKMRRLAPNDGSRIITEEECLYAIKEIGKRIVPNFEIDSENKDAYTKIAAYFMKLDIFENGEYYITAKGYIRKYEFSHEKGILIIGPTGTGKTDCLRIFDEFCRAFNTQINMKFKRCGEIEANFKEHGYSAVRFNDISNYIFDELAQESKESTRFNDKFNVMPYILQDSYNKWKQKGVLTFGTSNANGDILYDQYGELCFERICEMFNIIYLTGKNRRPKTIFKK